MGDRFPDIDWWCDRCNAHLNDQIGFDDHKYIWVVIKIASQLQTFMNPKKTSGMETINNCCAFGI